MNREIAALISDEATAALDRIAHSAAGVLATGDELRPNAQDRTPSTRIYSTPPNQTALECMINLALGMPGAKVEVTTTTESASRKLQSAKDRENGLVVKDHSKPMLDCHQKLKDFLPIAIERLMDLAAGVTVVVTHEDKTLAVTHRPNARSIDYIISRTEGRFASVLADLRVKFENPDLDFPYIPEDFAAMTQAEKDALREAADRSIENGTATELDPYADDPVRPTDANPGSHYPQPAAPDLQTPDYVAAANKQLAEFLPKAIIYLRTLARGAQTIIETENETNCTDHDPDLKSNICIVERFLGRPQSTLNIEIITPTELAA